MKRAPQSFMGAFYLDLFFTRDFAGRRDQSMGKVKPEGLLTTSSGLRVDIPPPFRTKTPMHDIQAALTGTTLPPVTGRTQSLSKAILLESHPTGIWCPTCSIELHHIMLYGNDDLLAVEDAGKNLLPGSVGKVEWSVIIKSDVRVPQSRQCYQCDPSSVYHPGVMSSAATVRIRKEQDGVIFASPESLVNILLYQRVDDVKGCDIRDIRGIRTPIEIYTPPDGEDRKTLTTIHLSGS